MVFKPQSYRKCPVPTFNIGGHNLKICTSYKYLGHMITDLQSDSEDFCDNVVVYMQKVTPLFGLTKNALMQSKHYTI